MSEPLLTARELAARLGMSPTWVMSEWRSGRLPGFKLGDSKRAPVRFRETDIERWLETRRRGMVA